MKSIAEGLAKGSEVVGTNRALSGVMRRVVAVMATATGCYLILFLSRVFDRIGLWLAPQQHLSIVLGLVLAMVFLLRPATGRSPRDRVPWYDLLLALLSLVPTFYTVFVFSEIEKVLDTALPTRLIIVLGFTLVALILEATRRAVSPFMTVVVAFFIFHSFFAPYFPGFLWSGASAVTTFIYTVYTSDHGIAGLPLYIAGTMVAAFIVFAQFLAETGASDIFMKVGFALTGTTRGGPAKASVVASSLFGTISGAVAANVVTTGTFTIPLMKSTGYRPAYAAAVEAAASNGGQLMPPVMGATAFIIAQWLGMSYWQVCLAAAVPAILYYLAVFVQVDAEAARLGLKGLPRDQLPSLIRSLTEGWHYFAVLAILIYFLFVVKFSPELAALYTTVGVVAVSMFRRRTRLGARQYLHALEGTGRALLEIVTACAAAGIIMGSVLLTGLGVNVSKIIIQLSGGNLAALLLFAFAACYILGMGITTVPLYIMMVILVAPALTQMGVPPIAAHLFVFYAAMTSFVTPPVALAAFVAAPIAGANPMKVGMIAMRLSIVCLVVPFVFVYRPGLLLIGNWPTVLWDILVTGLGVVCLAYAFSGNFLRRLYWQERALLLAVAAALFPPNMTANIAGLIIAAAVISWMLFRRPAARQGAASAAPAASDRGG